VRSSACVCKRLRKELVVVVGISVGCDGFAQVGRRVKEAGECIASGCEDCVPAEDIEAMVKHLSELDAYSRRWSLPMVLLFWFIPAMLLVVFVVYLVAQVMGA
jgi:hypothetical protein